MPRPWLVFKDIDGNVLHESGWQTYKADIGVFVCFDDYPWIGGFMHFFPAEVAKQIILTRWEKDEELAVEGRRRRGRGYLASPADLSARSFRFHETDRRGPIDIRAERLVEKFLLDFWCKCRPADKSEQNDGIDFIVRRGPLWRSCPVRLASRVQVKARGADKPYPRLFLQALECNPDGTGHRF